LVRLLQTFTGVFISLILLVTLATACQPKFQPGTYTDDRGRQVLINEIPQRIVSHVPGTTEILFALGLEEKIVGVSEYCDYPEEAKLKEKIGGFWNPSVEKIVDLHPDLVLTNGSIEQLIVNLDGLGIACLVIDPVDIDGIFKGYELLGKVTGVEERANQLIRDIKKDVSRVVDRVEGAPRVRVIYIIDAKDMTNPWTAGPGSFVDAFISMAGGENIAAQAPAPWVQFSIEEIVSADPEVIILPTKHGSAFTSPEEFKNHTAWRNVTAVKQDRIYLIDGDLIDRAGPRFVLGLEGIARIIHPELFE
jgi:iron complex transport system substrate-binding protein